MSTNWRPRWMSGDARCVCSSNIAPSWQRCTIVDLVILVSVLCRFHLESAEWLNKEEKSIVREKLSNIITKDGWILVKSDKTRSRTMNESDALDKLTNIVNEALKPPAPKISEEELAKIRKGKIKANKERLKNKQFRSDTKSSRGGPGL